MSSNPTPAYKVLMTYDIHPDKQEVYFRYVLGEFVPRLRNMGLPMLSAWHVIYGNYPQRLLEFGCDSRHHAHAIFIDPAYIRMEDRLKSYTINFERRLVVYRDGFQFF